MRSLRILPALLFLLLLGGCVFPSGDDNTSLAFMHCIDAKAIRIGYNRFISL
mgnify:CR=1 FL=1